jgi:putative endonuclease
MTTVGVEVIWRDGNLLNSTVVIPSEARDLQLKKQRFFFVYIMASRSLNLYVGVTSRLLVRVWEHKTGTVPGFTSRYRLTRLVYYETYRYVNNAIAREKEIKSWRRKKKIGLIGSMNPTWQDLAEKWYTEEQLRMRRPFPKSEEEIAGWFEKLQIPHSVRDDKAEGTADSSPLKGFGMTTRK